ncbi:MAG: serine/threonine-protein kinase [Planctomycetota bacterium]
MSDKTRFQRVSDLFELLREVPAADRVPAIEEACGGDEGLKREVEALLAAHDAPNALDSGPSAVAAAALAEAEPDRVGRYLIVSKLGEGGMGSVYEARQSDPDRSVALKIIKPGMDSAQVIARFEAERQALARMDHRAIARVYDAGATDRGRPYFVMELVRGEPIVAYCDRMGLDTPARLALFGEVCRAIQHAHQKGVIHRDIKPSNVLVSEVDGAPSPKVIDFGVAKAIDAELLGRTLYTEHGQAIGTPAYMSPEQASMGAEDIDTRSDVYSLGALLYELLTGATPFTDLELRELGFAEMMRVLQEQDPPRPSTRLSTLGEDAAAIAERRAADPALLRALLARDLDWIVMRCLEKERQRRYDSPGALADDVARYLSDQPVQARPASAGYRARKFVKRNRTTVIAAGLLIATLLLGVLGTGLGLIEAVEQRSLAEDSAREAMDNAETAEALTAFLLDDVIGAADPARTADAELTVREAVLSASENLGENLADRPRVELRVRQTLGRVLRQLSAYNEAGPHFERAVELSKDLVGPVHEDTLLARQTVVSNLMSQNRFAEAVDATLDLIDTLESEGPGESDVMVRAKSSLGEAYLATGRYDEAAPILEETLSAKRRDLGDKDPSTLASIHNLAGLQGSIGNRERALELAREAYNGRVEVLGVGDPRTFGSLNVLAWVLNGLGRHEESIEIQSEAINRATDRLGPDHAKTIELLRARASSYWNLGRFDDAERDLQLAAERSERVHGETLNTASAYFMLGSTNREQQRFDLSAQHFDRAFEIASGILPPDSADMANYHLGRGLGRLNTNQFEDSEIDLLRAAEIIDRVDESGIADPREVFKALVRLYELWDRAVPGAAHGEKADRWRELLELSRRE